MMKSPLEWNESDVRALVGQHESARLEFKSGRLFHKRDDAILNLSKAVSAFANSEGGTLVIGVDEEKVGIDRIAASVGGVDEADVQLQWLQQTLDANVSPYLHGIRYHYVRLTGDLSGRSCIIVLVPQGTTAHQAKDWRYYGRSECEIRALPDHEIRLRMQRSRLAIARVEILDWAGTGSPNWGAAVDEPELAATEVAEIMPLVAVSDMFDSDSIQAVFRLGIHNVGEITLREFLVEYEFVFGADISLCRGQKRSGPGLDESWTYRFFSDVNTRVYPGDLVRFPEDAWSIASNDADAFRPGTALLNWKVFIDNAPCVSGSTDLSRRFAFNVHA